MLTGTTLSPAKILFTRFSFFDFRMVDLKKGFFRNWAIKKRELATNVTNREVYSEVFIRSERYR